MELNKIAGAIILAGLIAMLAGKTSELLYGGGGHGDHHEKRGYEIAVNETAGDTGGAPAEKAIPNIATFLQTADAAEGEAYFKKRCASCHNYEQGSPNKIGPALWGVLNRDIGSVADFKYSDALASKEGNWDYKSLNHFLYAPKKWAPGTIMAYAGTKKEEERANLIMFLRSLGKGSVALPPIPVETTEEAEAVTEALEEATE